MLRYTNAFFLVKLLWEFRTNIRASLHFRLLFGLNVICQLFSKVLAA